MQWNSQLLFTILKGDKNDENMENTNANAFLVSLSLISSLLIKKRRDTPYRWKILIATHAFDEAVICRIPQHFLSYSSKLLLR